MNPYSDIGDQVAAANMASAAYANAARELRDQYALANFYATSAETLRFRAISELELSIQRRFDRCCHGRRR